MKQSASNAGFTVVLAASLSALIGLAGCHGSKRPTTAPAGPAAAEAPCPSPAGERVAATSPEAIPRFPGSSPFDTEYESPLPKQGKRLWADNFLWAKAPDLVVEKWLSAKPETKGKYVLIEFWATWCGPCRRSIPLLNTFHRKFGDELVVIGISDETEVDVRKLTDPKIEYYSAIDTQARMKNKMGVFGIPHAIVLEPDGYVIWQGFPLLKDYELTAEIIEKILAIGRKKSPPRE